MNSEELAQRATNQLKRADHKILSLLGVEIVEVHPGRSKAKLVVRDDLVNGANVCHGGIIFTLADFALAYAGMSNNHIGVTQSASIIYTNPAILGDTLLAEAQISFDGGGRTSAVNVLVTNQNGAQIAQMHAVWSKSKQQLVEE
ncbi:MAG: hotdog fold thioesterase [Chloroflexota bacterium]